MRIRHILALILAFSMALSGCTYHAEIVRLPDLPLYNQTVIFNNVQYIPLLRFCDYYNLEWSWDLVSERVEIAKGGKRLVLRTDSSLALLDGRAFDLDSPIEYKEGVAYIPASTAAYVSSEIFGLKEKPLPIKKWYEMKTVVIDPGHGGKDPGATSRYGTKEKHIVLDVAKRLKRHLEASGLQVILTRDTDRFVPLHKRAESANNKEADLFISIHANASRYSRAKGFEVYYLSEATDDNARALAAAENASLKFENNNNQGEASASADPTVWDLMLTENRRQSRELAYYICNVSSDALGMRKRGVKGARFAVLKGTTMPAVLVEIGFLTNRREESKLKTNGFRESIAGSISRSIVAYKMEYERTNAFSR